MPTSPEIQEVASALRMNIGMLLRRLRQAKAEGELTLPESAALSRLGRGGPTTAAALARLEQISPQSMSATLAGVQARGLVERTPDPEDGRRMILTITEAGTKVLENRHNQATEELGLALAADFTPAEIEQLAVAAPLLGRLAQSI
jgi:DNA-binding MarR family transcriptional regulator